MTRRIIALLALLGAILTLTEARLLRGEPPCHSEARELQAETGLTLASHYCGDKASRDRALKALYPRGRVR